jgi:flagellin
MRAQITGLETAQKNAKDGISLVQTAEGALTEVHSMLNRMYQLAEQSANGTYDSNLDRDQLNKEVTKLRTEIDRIGNTTNFNGTKLFAGAGPDTATVTGITGLTVSVTSTDKDLIDKDIAVIAQAGTQSAPNGAIALNGVSGYTWSSSDTGASLQGNVMTIAGSVSGSVTLTLTNNTDPAKMATITVDKSGFTSPSTQANGTIKLTSSTSTSYTAPTDTTTATGGTANHLSGNLEAGSISLWVGDGSDANNLLKIDPMTMNSSVLKITGSTVDISTQEGALDSLDYIKSAINKISDIRGTLGATQNRLEHTINNLSVMQENIQDAESTIRDTDVAEEMMKYTKNSILVQSAQAMLAQANQQPQGVLQLLQ